MVAFAVAGLALGAATVFGLLARAEASDLDAAQSDHLGDRAAAQELADAANTAGLVANISLGVAAAAGLTGGALLWRSADGAGAGAAWVIRW